MTLPSRRSFVTTVICAACCSGTPGWTETPARVDQLTDVNASAATGMFRFSPDLLTVTPGDDVVFLNSRGAHTVHSVTDLWPPNVDPVGISGQREARVTFPVEGFYGFRCKRHGQYGMVMLVVAGTPGIDTSLQDKLTTMKAKPRERAAFAALFDTYSGM